MRYIILILLVLLIAGCSSNSVLDGYNRYQNRFNDYNDLIDLQAMEYRNMVLNNASREELFSKSVKIEKEIDQFYSEADGFRQFIINNQKNLEKSGINVDAKLEALGFFMNDLKKEKYKWSISRLV